MNQPDLRSTKSKRSALSDATYVTAPITLAIVNDGDGNPTSAFDVDETTTRATINDGDGNLTSTFDVDGTTTNVESASLYLELLEKVQVICTWARISNRLKWTE